MSPSLTILLVTLAAMLFGAGLLHLVPRLGPGGRALSGALSRAPLLDIVVTYFTVAPLIAGPIAGARLSPETPWLGAGLGLLAGVLGQIAAVMVWTVLHELAHPEARRGPRIVHTLNRKVGRVRNHAAVWWTAWAVPVFWVIRVAQYFVYPPLTWLVRLPRYRASEWVNVSRHKFRGLVGHDLIWCLYCDWMTGVWSLGSEMLRNVESFWCPIRFYSEKKCENCKVDFPDVAGGWVAADGTMQDVTKVLQEQYGTIGPVKPWFGHPARLTIDGADPAPRR